MQIITNERHNKYPLIQITCYYELTKNATIKDNAKYDSKVRYWMKYLIKEYKI